MPKIIEKSIRISRTSFPIIMATIALMILGIAITPLLKVKLLPDRSLPSISVYYSLPGANAVVVDSELTSKLEGIFSNVGGLQKLRSRTGAGNGAITLDIAKDADMDAVRFEVSTLVRQVYPDLPPGASYPQIRVSRPDEEERVEQLLSFTLNGPGKRWEIGQLAEELIKPTLAAINGVSNVRLSGYTPLQWELVYNIGQLKGLGLSPQDISSQIKDYYRSENIGVTTQSATKGAIELFTPVVFSGKQNTETNWEAIRIRAGERILRLTELVSIRKKESEPSGYYRINGLNTISVSVLAAKTANQLMLAAKVKEQLAALKLPAGFTLQTTYDSTVFLKEELFKIVLRIGLSLLLLLLFVWLVSRSLRYLFVMALSMAANILIAFIFYHLFKLEIHIYSLAGITISLGIIIDNTIIMADHIRIGKGISVFRGVLAATLTTAGALVVVFFLDEEQQLLLLDFVYVIIINLSVSLCISLFFVPALLSRYPLPSPAEKRSFKLKKRLVRLYWRYGKCIRFSARFRIVIFIVAILGFGLPVFLLPAHLNGDSWFNKSYNAVFGSNTYNEHIRTVVDKSLGGTLRLFLKETKHSSGSSARRTIVTVSADMYEGTTLKQTNQIIKRIENFLTVYDEIEQFQTHVYSSGSSVVRIYFKPEHEFTSFPHSLKSELESKVVDMGVGDWTITGVGRGFDNSLREGYRNSRVTFYGYNLEALKGYADKFKKYLLDIQRVDAKSIFINGRATRSGKVNKDWVLNLDEDRLAQANLSTGAVLHELRKLSDEHVKVLDIYTDGMREPVVLKTSEEKIPDNWQFYNQALPIGKDKFARVKNYGQLKRERATNLINKENMEYTMVVEFDFIGSPGQKEYLVGRVIKKMSDELPIGFRLKQQTFFGGFWSDKNEKDNRLLIILLVLTIIYSICAVVFESLVQPLIVLAMIPLSFIGVFLTFYFLEVGFGPGGYASLLLLSGLTVNSALYVINDLNNVREKSPQLNRLKQYIQAVKQKIVPIMLTIFSTVLGLVPFLYGGKKELFWYSLSIGTMGGLLFSVIALVFILPLFVRGVKQKRIKKQINEK